MRPPCQRETDGIPQTRRMEEPMIHLDLRYWCLYRQALTRPETTTLNERSRPSSQSTILSFTGAEYPDQLDYREDDWIKWKERK